MVVVLSKVTTGKRSKLSVALTSLSLSDKSVPHSLVKESPECLVAIDGVMGRITGGIESLLGAIFERMMVCVPWLVFPQASVAVQVLV